MHSEHQMLKSYLKAAARGIVEQENDMRETALAALIAIERLEAKLELLEKVTRELNND